MSRTLIRFSWLCGSEEFDTFATNQQDAHDFACEEVQRRGLSGPLKLVGSEPYDPTGGDGPED